MDALQSEAVHKKIYITIASSVFRLFWYETVSYGGDRIFFNGVILIFKYLLANFD